MDFVHNIKIVNDAGKTLADDYSGLTLEEAAEDAVESARCRTNDESWRVDRIISESRSPKRCSKLPSAFG